MWKAQYARLATACACIVGCTSISFWYGNAAYIYDLFGQTPPAGIVSSSAGFGSIDSPAISGLPAVSSNQGTSQSPSGSSFGNLPMGGSAVFSNIAGSDNSVLPFQNTSSASLITTDILSNASAVSTVTPSIPPGAVVANSASSSSSSSAGNNSSSASDSSSSHASSAASPANTSSVSVGSTSFAPVVSSSSSSSTSVSSTSASVTPGEGTSTNHASGNTDTNVSSHTPPANTFAGIVSSSSSSSSNSASNGSNTSSDRNSSSSGTTVSGSGFSGNSPGWDGTTFINGLVTEIYHSLTGSTMSNSGSFSSGTVDSISVSTGSQVSGSGFVRQDVSLQESVRIGSWTRSESGTLDRRPSELDHTSSGTVAGNSDNAQESMPPPRKKNRLLRPDDIALVESIIAAIPESQRMDVLQKTLVRIGDRQDRIRNSPAISTRNGTRTITMLYEIKAIVERHIAELSAPSN